MNVRITPQNLFGEITAPVSKSSVHRLMICAALGDKPTEIRFSGAVSDDITATRRCLEGLGATVTDSDHGVIVTPFDKNAPVPDEPLDCGESGSTLRFLIPVAAALGGTRRFILRGRLPERPLSPLKEELERHGAKISLDGDILTVCGDGMTYGEFVIDGGVSSQFISGLLFTLPLMDDASIRVTGRVESRPYIDMTIAALYNYGIRISEEDGVLTLSGRESSPNTVLAEGDWSGAAFYVCAGALSRNGIRICGLDTASLQGDRRILQIVRDMGAVVEEYQGEVFVRRGDLCGITVDAADIPDLVPVVAALAAVAEGTTTITGTKRLRLKESDRIKTTCDMIYALGGCAKGDDESIRINGGLGMPVSEVDSAGDHRIAMAAAILSIAAKADTTILGAECVKKSYPAFWEDYERLSGCIKGTF